MTSGRPPDNPAWFGEFEVRLDSGELFRNGSRVRRGYRFIAPVAWSRTRSTAARTSSLLAVLPLVNLAGDPAREYVADGSSTLTRAILAVVDYEKRWDFEGAAGGAVLTRSSGRLSGPP